ncbi:hypothetical protein O181_096350 [Austropuccinia psidii MF-1]|uniref:Uncharacterized protein n=1 Tax=Austropuccinia psidii MF-1 TaxID=1389203 RepID=A0A9Q3J5H2_9BASI|nr:hypothetical protein [Austropuccinia psidii MF-1]
METCAVSKLEDWKELPVEKKPSSNTQAISEEHPEIFKEEEIKESEEKVEIQEELASNAEEDIKPKSKEINFTGVRPQEEKIGILVTKYLTPSTVIISGILRK